MLKQILSDMYVDPELLAELSEEQKQILFFKMRQEQVRRWKEREAVATALKPTLKEDHGKSVQWKLGADGDVWVWVMGEHILDKPYDLLCSEILAERVRQQSLQQAEAIRTPVERVTEGSIPSPPQFLSGPQPGSEILQGSKTFVKRDAPKRVENTAAVGNHRNLEYVQYGGPKQQMKGDDPLPSMHEMTTRGCHYRASTKAKQLMFPRPLREGSKESRFPHLCHQSLKTSQPKELMGNQTELNLNPAKYLNHLFFCHGRKQTLQRSISSSTQENIIQWFKEEQFNLRAGFEKSTDQIAPWFHGTGIDLSQSKGILTTKRAEELLEGLAPGSFLIRVSEKIKGYVLSYLSAEGCKHFLIDASGDSYSFLGVDQLQHSTLADLVDYHKDEPITSLGKELLHYPCGQQGLLPDYLDLFE
ncbi:SH2 domain-containing protein 4A isoform X4 [Candoia aspera]|uniref:SH2 domain-containing protein 4A isoform X4 n=1 Tax=Candoia aspera TaxID=51853 RepID=UPI002FD7ED2B